MDRNLTLKPARRAGDRPQVLLRLYVSGRSEYTQAVLENVDEITRRYDPDEVIVQVRDADEAEADERVFFTPMLIVQDARDLDHRTVVVGDLRQSDVITTLLSGHGIVARQ
jgi:hypothetical protein